MSTILIYDDEGVSQDCMLELNRFFATKKMTTLSVSGQMLRVPGTLSGAKLLIVPGGRSLPFYDSLGREGNNHIINFVNNGGAYLGLCAGAYYACRQTIFAKNSPNELILPGALNFFEGSAIGPLFASNDFTYESENGARIVSIVDDVDTVSLYFNGGCHFTSNLKDHEVLARYESNNLAAIVVRQVGSGMVLLSGVHPELSYRTISPHISVHHAKLYAKLFAVERERVLFFERLISRVYPI